MSGTRIAVSSTLGALPGYSGVCSAHSQVCPTPTTRPGYTNRCPAPSSPRFAAVRLRSIMIQYLLSIIDDIV